MFLRIVVSILMIASHLIGEIYKGCGESEKVARDELAKSIYVSVASEYERVDKVSQDGSEKDIKSISKQSTNLKLINVKVDSSQDGKVCATISEEDLKKSLSSAVTEINSFNISQLAQKPKEAKKELENIIESCESSIKLASVLGEKREIANISRKLQAFKSRLEKIYTQSVKFNLPEQNLKIYIDGDKKEYKINEDIPLKIGEHQYTIISNSHCDIKGSFSLAEDETEIIDNIDINDYRYPKVTFSSNKNKSYISLEADGEKRSIGVEQTIKRCEGDFIYRAEYKDGSFKDVEDGKIPLKHGLNRVIHLEFLSMGDIKEIQNEAKPYTSGDRLEILYSYGYVSKDNEYHKDTHNIAIHKLTHKRFFRYGYGLLYGVDELNAPDVKVAEIYYLFAVQFTSFGSNDLPLRIGGVSFIPYAGLELGIGYHEFKYNEEKIYSYPREDDDDADRSPEDYDWSFRRDSLVLKPVVGVDIILSRGFALKLYGERNIYIDNRWFFGTGLSIEF